MRWGVLGATSAIYHKRLKPAFALAGATIVGEASRRGADDFSAYDELLQRRDVDAIYIPLPNALHLDWIRRSLEAGKHVLCEKPLTLSEADTHEAFDVAVACGRTLVEAYMWPHHPRAQRILSLVADGEIGRLESHFSAFTFPLVDATNHRVDERGAGALFDIGIYCLSPALLMTGAEPGLVAARAVRNERGVDTSMSGLVELGDAAATFHVSFTASERRYQYVSCSTGWFEVDDHTPGPEHAGHIVVHRADGSIEHVDHAGANAFERMISSFTDVCAGRAAPPWGAVDSIRLARLFERLHEASH